MRRLKLKSIHRLFYDVIAICGIKIAEDSAHGARNLQAILK